jgi:hypothetical protein
MIIRLGYKRLLWIAFGLLMAGVIIAFLMVIRVLESTFFLNFLAYICSLLGVVAGTYGTGLYVTSHRKRDKDR